MRVKPAPGIKIRCPETFELFTEDDEVIVPINSTNHLYWVRRVRDGDAVVIEADVRGNA